jgi:3-isopropylmalate/(R)-2-methylmalate dehydratase small subunit
MEAFTILTAHAVPFDQSSIDTDQIIPARFLKCSRKEGYGNFLFYDLRFDEAGAERPDFILNRPEYRAAGIIIAGANFACGSSREGAVYALFDYGVRAVIAPSFGDIFHANCFKNGLLPVRLPEDQVAGLRHVVRERPGAAMTVDLRSCTITDPTGARLSFGIDPFWGEALLQGLDEIGLTMTYRQKIADFEQQYHGEMAWLP